MMDHFHNLINNLHQQPKCTPEIEMNPMVYALLLHSVVVCMRALHTLVQLCLNDKWIDFISPDCQPPPPPPPPPPKKPPDAIATHASAHTNTCNKIQTTQILFHFNCTDHHCSRKCIFHRTLHLNAHRFFKQNCKSNSFSLF